MIYQQKVLIKLSKFYNTNIDYLLGLTDETKKKKKKK